MHSQNLFFEKLENNNRHTYRQTDRNTNRQNLLIKTPRWGINKKGFWQYFQIMLWEAEQYDLTINWLSSSLNKFESLSTTSLEGVMLFFLISFLNISLCSLTILRSSGSELHLKLLASWWSASQWQQASLWRPGYLFLKIQFECLKTA